MSNNILNCEIDLGYWFSNLRTRKILGEKNIRLRSKVEFTTDALISGAGTYHFRHDDLKGVVGEGASQHSLELDKTRDKAYKVLAYSLIALAIEKNKDQMERDKEFPIINLVTNYPLNIYNGQTKEQFEEFLKTSDFIHVFVNREHKLFWLKNCTVFPQTVPVSYANPSAFKNQIKGIVDIGGMTTQGVILDSFNIIPSSRFTENLGCLNLYNKVRKALNSYFTVNIQDYEMPTIIKNGLRVNTKKSLEIIDEIIRDHIKEIQNAMTVNNWNEENIPIMFTGGGSLLLREYLEEMFPHVEFSQDPLWDNAKGLRKVGEIFYGRQN
ncbi:ParM/StbA family protein [Natranaerobius thermophilus]|nr:ParM/StbA family protein [Natranaerobius thermophilus]